MTTGTEYLLKLLRAQGVRCLFGNPGHTELTLLDQLVAMPDMQYVLALHEGSAMAMADGYAMASGKLGVFCGHIMPGLGNSLGMLFNANKHGSPVLVTAGQQDQGFSLTEPFLWGDLVSQARPLTKWAYEVRGVDELERALKRAVKVALTPPMGPVFLSLPKDVMAGSEEFGSVHLSETGHRLCADRVAIREAARVLAEARAPLVIAGDEVGKAGAEEELEAVARLLGGAVYSETASIRFNFTPQSPLYQGTLGRMQRDVHSVLETADVIFAVGAEVFTLAAAARTEPLPPTCRLVQLNIDSWQLGKNYSPEVALWGDPKTTLTALDEELRARMDGPAQRAAKERAAALARRKAEKLAELDAQIESRAADMPLAGGVALRGLLEHLPDDAIVVDESATTGLTLRALMCRRPLAYFGLKGGGLGWAVPASVGIQLACPERPVVCLVGDGGALFSIQSLWTAAHYGARVVFVICNNAQYRLIKHRLHLFGGGASVRARRYLGVELDNPSIDFEELARGMGLPAIRVERAADIGTALRTSLAVKGPALVDLRVEGSYPERDSIDPPAARQAAQ